MINDQNTNHITPSHDTALSRHDATYHDNDAIHLDNTKSHQDTNQDREKTAEEKDKTAKLYTLSIPRVHQILMEAGHPVSERTVIRWCAKGLLEATLRPEENGQYEKYYVNKSSVEKRISDLRRVQPENILSRQTQSHDAIHRDNTKSQQDDDATNESVSRHDAIHRDKENKNEVGGTNALQEKNELLKQENAELERKLMSAEIEKAAAHHVREHLMKQNTSLIDELQKKNYALGNAEARLHALEAPRNNYGQKVDFGASE